MKKFIAFILIAFSFAPVFAQYQNVGFEKYVSDALQSFDDRGYDRESVTIGQIVDTVPLVSDTISFTEGVHYFVVVEADNCQYCKLNLYFVDSENNMKEVQLGDGEIIRDEYSRRILKFKSQGNYSGRYVLFIKSKLCYDMALMVYSKDFRY